MIRYKKKLTVNQVPNAEYRIESDASDRYEAFRVLNTAHPWTDWWNMNHQSDLRVWQKDILRSFGWFWTDLTPLVVYKRSQGHSQPHDVALAYAPDSHIWILITEKDFWIKKSKYGQVTFDVEDSMGSILDPNVRKEIYLVLDGLKQPA